MEHVMSPLPKTGLTGRHVLLAMLAFFGVIFAVNGAFLYFALGSYSGVVAVEPYRKGLAYNERIAADQKQLALGWSPVLEMSLDGAVNLTLADRDRSPVTGLLVTAEIGRPSTSAEDIKVPLEEISPGQYVARIPARAPGNWVLSVTAVRPGADPSEPALYRLKERKWLKP